MSCDQLIHRPGLWQFDAIRGLVWRLTVKSARSEFLYRYVTVGTKTDVHIPWGLAML